MAEPRDAARQRRYLAGALALCILFVIVAVAAMIRSGSGTSGPARPVPPPSEQALRKALDQNPAPEQTKTPAQQAQETIASYRKQLEASPNSPDTPAVLNAMGNLYRQKLLDYKEAARCYERIILEFPQWEAAPAIYPLLSTCYEKTGDHQSLLWLYQEMMKRFPEDSQEYLFAKEELGL
jgi:tetratricopeptide (TPR) repeat protein